MMRWLWSDGVMKTMRRHNTVLWNMNMRGECPGKRYFFGVSMESEILLLLRKPKILGDCKRKLSCWWREKKDKTAGECCMKPLNGSCGTVVAWDVPVPEEKNTRKRHKLEKIQWTRIPGDHVTTALLMSGRRSLVDLYSRSAYCLINCRVEPYWFWWLR